MPKTSCPAVQLASFNADVSFSSWNFRMHASEKQQMIHVYAFY